MTPPNPLIEQMAMYTLVLLTGIILHELIHYATAAALGLQPRLTLKAKGPTVHLPEYADYRKFSELPTLKMKVDYALISLAPYILLPAYIHLAQSTPEPGAKLAFLTLASMHVASIITEFKQSPAAMGLASLLALGALYLLAP